MSILVRLGLRRPHPWDPPTALDKLLDGPLHHLVAAAHSFLVRLRGTPFALPAGRPRIRVVCISDTHEHTLGSVPDGDLLIHAGDLTSSGTVEAIQRQLDWLGSLPHQHKVVVAGNHDTWLDPVARPHLPAAAAAAAASAEGADELDFGDVVYLLDELVRLDFKPSGRSLAVFGSPHIPRCGGAEHAFQYLRDFPPWEGKVPLETDILVTHTPPRHHLDLGLGCAGLLEEVWRVRPRLHVFGHVHSGAGRQAVFFDDAQRAFERLMARPKRGLILDLFTPHAGWLDAVKVLLYGVNAVLFKWIMLGPGSNNGSVMINAAQMYRNTGKMGNSIQVVDL
ncbi:hypothetical protein RB598_001588 [Gaeumannomyces tritici]